MAKIRPCREHLCPFSAMKGKQRCSWHFLLVQPAAAQQVAAERRLVRTPPEQRRARVPAAQWPAGGRWCSGCQSMVPDFYTTGSRCKACASRASHGAAIEKKYGLTPERYAQILAAQGGRCAICGKLPRTIRLAVDHDHATGAVRGLLCASGDHGCNKGLGFFNDDAETILRAYHYLVDPPAGRV